jgi:hypothetical protein
MTTKQKQIKVKANLTSNTPLKLYAEIARPLNQRLREMILTHGAAYAVNFALAEHLKTIGVEMPEIIPPIERIRAGQKRRWKAAKKNAAEIEKKASEEKAKRRERDKARRAKKAETKPEAA